MRDIMVSICCLTYNHEKYIRKTLESFVNQITDFNYEILIHDDCSTDNTVNIIKEYKDKYPNLIKPIYQEKNQYSRGIKISNIFQFPRAKGKYIAMCEGDDYWCNEYKLQRQFDILENNPGCSFCTHIVQHINESGEIINRIQPNSTLNLLLNEGIISSDIVFKNILTKTIIPFQTSCYFFKREYVMEYLATFSRKLNIFDFGDVPLSWYLYTRGDCYFINTIMSCYRENSIGSWSNKYIEVNNSLKHFEQLIDFFHIFNEYTNRRYDSQIKYLIKKYKYKILELKKEFRQMITKEYYLIFKEKSIKYKIRTYLYAYFPKFEKIYSYIRNRSKK